MKKRLLVIVLLARPLYEKKNTPKNKRMNNDFAAKKFAIL